MNKQIIAIIAAAGFSLSAGVVSAATPISGNVSVTGGVGGQCPMIGDTIRVGVSANVVGAYECDEVTNLVQVAACHRGGSRQQGVLCVTSTPVPPATEGVLPEGCTAELEAAGGRSPIPDYKAFYTSSLGGVMEEQQLGSRCSDTTILGISGFQ